MNTRDRHAEEELAQLASLQHPRGGVGASLNGDGFDGGGDHSAAGGACGGGGSGGEVSRRTRSALSATSTVPPSCSTT
jgi:hypothetical protein